MHYKNFFSAAALVTLLTLSSNSAFSDPAGLEEGDASYYVRLQYNGELLPFKTKIDTFTATKDSDTTLDPFKASFIGGGAEFGYKMEDFRVGVEGVYSQLNKNADTGVVLAPADAAAEKLTAIAVLVNVNYDIAIIEDLPVAPYVGVGVGAAYINNPLKAPFNEQKSGFGVAYQAKAGVSYAVTPEINLYAGARYFGSYGAKFDKSGEEGDKGKGDIKVLYSVVGAEAGVAFNF
ncbi:P44/Msp2 family outer membrane protein [Wolbachia endosymbiont of Folsomia candida]|uniref:P44/Msp2 family outer membrane protein n=1 Tax=Wolbachia endosymbiont of Folsomia candida TaxID=169402 RepID=UPI000B315D91|nr:P44/Msp2 family outer membrane protein [Wolbachia endosymbiont of Folsomia candida]APR98317.1 P44/Msp2 family outer membrane protein [Wolbachia endosymbiont of Folsomia candida]